MGNKGKVLDNSKYLERYKKIGEVETALKAQFAGMPKKQLNVVEGLIKRAAFMRVLLEGLEEDIKKNGEFELFTQSDMVEPYQRKRPAVDIYNITIKNYANAVKQLTDLLPKEVPQAKKDPVDDFLNGREDI